MDIVAADPKLTQVFYLPCPNIGQGNIKVITMEMLGRIRRMHMRDKVSLHEIAKRTPGFSKLSAYVAELEQSVKADAQPRWMSA